jgi:hypothetical protein
MYAANVAGEDDGSEEEGEEMPEGWLEVHDARK